MSPTAQHVEQQKQNFKLWSSWCLLLHYLMHHNSFSLLTFICTLQLTSKLITSECNVGKNQVELATLFLVRGMRVRKNKEQGHHSVSLFDSVFCYRSAVVCLVCRLMLCFGSGRRVEKGEGKRISDELLLLLRGLKSPPQAVCELQDLRRC